MGSVVNITKTSLSVQFRNGNDVLLLFPTPALLGTGEPTNSNEVSSYPLSAIEKNDLVDATYILRNGKYVCIRLMIYRRPGGKIPPLQRDLPKGQFLGTMKPHHERMQAYQDWEEKGTPIPAKYLPAAGLSTPYPPVAPAPRPAAPRP